MLKVEVNSNSNKLCVQNHSSARACETVADEQLPMIMPAYTLLQSVMETGVTVMVNEHRGIVLS